MQNLFVNHSWHSHNFLHRKEIVISSRSYFCNLLILLIFQLKSKLHCIMQTVLCPAPTRSASGIILYYKQKFYHSGLCVIIKTFFVVRLANWCPFVKNEIRQIFATVDIKDKQTWSLNDKRSPFPEATF